MSASICANWNLPIRTCSLRKLCGVLGAHVLVSHKLWHETRIERDDRSGMIERCDETYVPHFLTADRSKKGAKNGQPKRLRITAIVFQLQVAKV